MRPPRIGVFLRGDRLTVVALTGRDRLTHVAIEGAEDPAATLAGELHSRGLGAGRLRVGLDRRLAVVKAIELPPATGADLARMVGFDLERHVPFPPEQIRFDWLELPGRPGEPRRALVAAAETRTIERPLALIAGAKRQPAALTVACHGLIALLPGALPAHHAVWAHRHDGVADLLFLDGRTLLTSRQVAAVDPAELAREIRRSLPVVHWSDADEVWLSGPAADDARAWRDALTVALGVPATAPPFAASVLPLVAALPADDQGPGLLALGVAAESRSPALNLLPAAARPWAPSRGQIVAAAMVAIVALLGLSMGLVHVVQQERYLGRVTAEIHRLEPEAKAVDALADELGRKRRVLAALVSAEEGRVPALPVLRELTETLPAGAWLQALSMDGRGVELTGQADGASALIPLLEASSRLERAEFTSPVTKTQSKEQFRIRAAWEKAPRPALSLERKGSR
ncbi:MAG TPA: PilN domain-containing protein [Methylomirabilota bacterium]|nr:PilN domain-containing protein [Methylomirabilota bacterium]